MGQKWGTVFFKCLTFIFLFQCLTQKYGFFLTRTQTDKKKPLCPYLCWLWEEWLSDQLGQGFDDPGKYLRATGFFKEFILVLSPNKLNPRYENVNSFLELKFTCEKNFLLTKRYFPSPKCLSKILWSHFFNLFIYTYRVCPFRDPGT